MDIETQDEYFPHYALSGIWILVADTKKLPTCKLKHSRKLHFITKQNTHLQKAFHSNDYSDSNFKVINVFEIYSSKCLETITFRTVIRYHYYMIGNKK